ncbi:MAG: hypothetical protein RL113_444, partial [Pseudomonadota bacterium]
TSTIYDIHLIHYNHPFVHFEATVSEGTYIRSLGALIAEKLGVDGTLSSLHRIHEGDFYFDDEKAIDPFSHLSIPANFYKGEYETIELGKKLAVEDFETTQDGMYLIESQRFYAIIEIADKMVNYKLNRIPKFEGS